MSKLVLWDSHQGAEGPSTTYWSTVLTGTILLHCPATNAVHVALHAGSGKPQTGQQPHGWEGTEGCSQCWSSVLWIMVSEENMMAAEESFICLIELRAFSLLLFLYDVLVGTRWCSCLVCVCRAAAVASLCIVLLFFFLTTCRHNLGKVLDVLGDHESAAECLMTAVELESSSPVIPFTVIPRPLQWTVCTSTGCRSEAGMWEWKTYLPVVSTFDQ